MEIGLGIWQGEYEGVTRPWLRWYDADGVWIPSKDERIEQERCPKGGLRPSRAEQERAQRQDAERLAEQERTRREETESENMRLKERLRKLGIDPDEG